jgi:hypothetical protein
MGSGFSKNEYINPDETQVSIATLHSPWTANIIATQENLPTDVSCT